MRDIRLAELIPESQILSDMTAKTKDDALAEMAVMLSGAVGVELQQPILAALEQRERLASTGIGEQVAIPHGKLDDLPCMVAGLARSRRGIDFGAIDGQRTHLFFVIVAPGQA
jgi:mannitol/fructose-specific phosphotransferase system IIA component (Ntr-type)